jgi:hypothetical protein
VPWEALPGLDAVRRWVAPAGVALVRPDRVVFGTSPTRDAAALVAAATTAAFRGSTGGAA